MIKAIFRIAVICIIWYGASSHANAATITLYDDTANALPAAQPWLFYLPLGGTASQSLISAGAQLTTDLPVMAGYSNTNPFSRQHVNANFPALDRSTGFSLVFELEVLSEMHNNANRAGFSVILLASDKLGIEIGFWGDEIWAQSGPNFTHAEGKDFDTTAGETTYTLEIVNAGYSLSADTNELFSGPLRDYSSAPFLVYSLTDYLFMGDDTSSAKADVALGLVQLHTLTAIPLPGSALLFFSGLAGFGFFNRRK